MKKLPLHLDTVAPAGLLDIVPDEAAGFSFAQAVVVAGLFVVVFAGMVELVRQEWLDPTILILNVVPIWIGVRYYRSVRFSMRGWAAVFAALPRGSLTSAVVESFLNENPLAGTRFSLRYLTRALAAGGHVGQGVRIGRTGPRLPIRPLVVQFEPLPLDETDDTFRHLSESTRLKNVASGRRDQDASQILRWLRRHLELNSGRWWLKPLVFCAVMQLVIYLRSGRMGYFFGIWLLIAAFLLIPTGFRLRSRQFLAVPGGLIVRRPKWPGGWRGRLFTRESSVVCGYQSGLGHWSLIISDGKVVETTKGTQAEIAFALRAWYSPVAPPTLEQLSDLV
jgi:hypothetical protein